MSYRYAQGRANAAQYRSNSPIGDEIIRAIAPSVFAAQAHESRGERYAFIPTSDVLAGLRREGFEPFEVRQTRVRDESKRDFTRHMLRLRHPNAITTREEVPEIVLLNSHDGTSAYQLLAGFFRMVCSNGLIAGTITNDIRIRHSGNVVHNVIEGSYKVLSNIETAASRIEAYKSITLNDAEQQNFASEALRLRWDEGAPINSNRALLPRRWEDKDVDLWSVFNRVQENLVRGGQRGYSASGRRLTTRAIGGVNEDVRINRQLWDLADAVAQQKMAA